MPEQHQFSLPAGHLLKQYRLERLLGHGGFGLTYLAIDTFLNRRVTIKELLPMDFAVRATDGTTVLARGNHQQPHLDWARKRFLEEGRTLAALHHPSILAIHDILEQNDTAYLVTSFVDGVDFQQWLAQRKGRCSEVELSAILFPILDALQLVHQRGFLHRDLKPENILMESRSNRPVLIDFGNARVATGEKTANMTVVLTPGYAPFEQYTTRGRQGPWTDLYAVGAILYKAITGKPPPQATDRIDEDNIHILSRQVPPGFSREFVAAVDKALQTRRENRWQSCHEWRSSLSQKPRKSALDVEANHRHPTTKAKCSKWDWFLVTCIVLLCLSLFSVAVGVVAAFLPDKHLKGLEEGKRSSSGLSNPGGSKNEHRPKQKSPDPSGFPQHDDGEIPKELRGPRSPSKAPEKAKPKVDGFRASKWRTV